MSMIARIQIVGDQYSAASGLDTLYHNNKKFRDEHLLAADQEQLDIDGNGLNGSRYSALGKRVNGQVVQARLERQVASAKMLAGAEAMFDFQGADVFIFVLTTHFPAAEMLAAMKQNGVNQVADAKKEHTANISRLIKLARETNPQAKFYLVCDISAKYEQGIDADKRPISRVAASMKASAHDAEFYECNRDAYVSPYAEQGQTQRDLYEAVFDGVLQRYLQLHPVPNGSGSNDDDFLLTRSKLYYEIFKLEGELLRSDLPTALRSEYVELVKKLNCQIADFDATFANVESGGGCVEDATTESVAIQVTDEKPKKDKYAKLRVRAEAGETKAQYELGCKYLKDRSNQGACRQGTKYLQRAARAGHVKAQEQMAECYQNGLGVDKNMEKVTLYLFLAACDGSKQSIKKLRLVPLKYFRSLSTEAQSQAIYLLAGKNLKDAKKASPGLQFSLDTMFYTMIDPNMHEDAELLALAMDLLKRNNARHTDISTLMIKQVYHALSSMTWEDYQAESKEFIQSSTFKKLKKDYQRSLKAKGAESNEELAEIFNEHFKCVLSKLFYLLCGTLHNRVLPTDYTNFYLPLGTDKLTRIDWPFARLLQSSNPSLIPNMESDMRTILFDRLCNHVREAVWESLQNKPVLQKLLTSMRSTSEIDQSTYEKLSQAIPLMTRGKCLEHLLQIKFSDSIAEQLDVMLKDKSPRDLFTAYIIDYFASLQQSCWEAVMVKLMNHYKLVMTQANNSSTSQPVGEVKMF